MLLSWGEDIETRIKFIKTGTMRRIEKKYASNLN